MWVCVCLRVCVRERVVGVFHREVTHTHTCGVPISVILWARKGGGQNFWDIVLFWGRVGVVFWIYTLLCLLLVVCG